MAGSYVKKTLSDVFAQVADTLESGVAYGGAPVALTALGSELDEQVLYDAAKQAADGGVSVKLIGSTPIEYPGIEWVEASDADDSHKKLEALLAQGDVSGGVTMHYPFPIGVSTVGRVITPATGKEMFLATTTGTVALDRVEALIRNTLSGIATAKACGIAEPTVGLLNIDGARQAEIALNKLKEAGYPINFAQSGRSDGGAILRGNDLLMGTCDVAVMDSLTGNLLMKMFSAFQTGGSYEAVGYGYGPGIGEGFDDLVMIISRASGTPVVRNALIYASQLVRGDWKTFFAQEIAAAKKAGLDAVLDSLKSKEVEAAPEEITAPDAVVVTEEIAGIEILDLEDAVRVLWKAGVYAESGMGCTGPVILLAEEALEEARRLLKDAGYIGE